MHRNIIEVPDLLDRQQFVDRLSEIAMMMSLRKKNVCYSINGEWGSGKSFVLKMFEERIEEIQSEELASERYIVIRYNCWEYDYYNEPLVSIVAALADRISEKEKLIPEEKKEKIIGILKLVGTEFLKGIGKKSESLTGVNIAELSDKIRSGLEKIDEDWITKHEYDPYFEFKKTLECLRQIVADLTQERTMVVIVDELDRCLPEYTIRVLERLHHVFDGLQNVQIVLGIDKKQLGYAIRQIFGEETSVNKYLAKFIDFEVNLVRGELKKSLRDQYPEYFNCFENQLYSAEEVDEFYLTILKDVDMRSCNAIIEKCYLCHRLLNINDAKYGSHVLCMEVFLSLLKHFELDFETIKSNSNSEIQLSSPKLLKGANRVLPGFAVIVERLKKGAPNGYEYRVHHEGKTHINCYDLYGLALGCYRLVTGNNDYWFQERFNQKEMRQYVLDYWRLLKTIA